VEGFSTVLEASVVSIVISSFGRSADEGLFGVDPNARDNSSAPRIDWDAMVDNCEERIRIKNWNHFGKRVNCFT